MKKSKKLVALFSAAAMVLTQIAALAVTDSAGNPILADDNFEDYTASTYTQNEENDVTNDLVLRDFAYLTDESGNPVLNNDRKVTGGVVVAEGWTNVSTAGGLFNNGYDNTAQNAVVTMEKNGNMNNKALAVEGRASSGAVNLAGTVVYDTLIDSSVKTQYKVDLMRGDNNSNAVGIKFNMRGNSYYALVFDCSVGSSEGTKKTALYKVVNGTITRLGSDVVKVETDENPDWAVLGNYIGGRGWYTLTLTVEGGQIDWTLLPADGKSEIGHFRSQTGSFTDPEPFAEASTQVALMSMNNSGVYGFFDNFSVKQMISDCTIYETFENYEVPELAEGESYYVKYSDGTADTSDYSLGGTRLAPSVAKGEGESVVEGLWENAADWSWDNQGYSGLVKDPLGVNGNVLAIESRAGHYGPNLFPSVKNTIAIDGTKDVIYKFDIMRGEVFNPGGGIRFNINGNNYYELTFLGYSNSQRYTDGTYATNLYKVTNGNSTRILDGITIETTDGNANYKDFNCLREKRWYTVTLTVKTTGEITWEATEPSGTYSQTGSWTDPEPISAAKYNMALMAGGAGGFHTFFDNVSVKNPPTPEKYTTYTDSFDSYTAENAAIGAENVVTLQNGSTVIETANGNWEVSKVHNWMGQTGGYVDGNNEYFVIRGINNALRGNGTYTSVVNFDVDGRYIEELGSISASYTRDNEVAMSGAGGIRFAISDDEQTYYEVGSGAWWDIDNKNTETLVPSTGYIMKSVNGVRSLVHTFAGGWAPAANYSIMFNSSRITVNANDYSYSFIDEDGLLGGMRYPMALISVGEVFYDDVTLRYVPEALEYDVVEGVANLNIKPASYGAASVNVVTAFYGADGALLDTSDKRTISEETAYTVDVPANAADTKVYILDSGDNLIKTVGADEEAAPADTKKIVAAVGDSLTGNGGLFSNHTWSNRLGALLGPDYIVKNYGDPGETVSSYMTLQPYADSLQSNADIVMIMLGTNDLGNLGNGVTDKATFKTSYKTLIDSYITAFGADTEFILAVPPIREERGGNGDNIGVKPREIDGVSNITHTYTAQPVVREVIKEFTKEYDNISYVDNYILLDDPTLSYDGTHFFDKGYFIFAENFYNALNKKTDVTVDDNTVTINPIRNLQTDVIVAAYEDGKLAGVKAVTDLYLDSAVDKTIDISDMAKGDTIKVMFMDTETMEVETYCTAKYSENVAVNGRNVTIKGNAADDEEVAVSVYNADNALVCMGIAKAGRDGSYQLTLTMPEGASSGTYTVDMGTATNPTFAY